MRAVVPQGRRERIANYGDTETVVGGNRKAIFSHRKEQGFQLLLTVQCTEFRLPPAAVGTGDFRPFVHVDWGHGASSASTDIDCTFRQRFPVAASEVEVQAFIASFPFPGQPAAVAVPDQAVAKFRAFVSEGIDGIPLFDTRWLTQLNVSSGVFAKGQAQLASARVFNPTAGAVQYFLLFDQPSAPIAGDVPFDGAPVTPNVLTPIPLGQTRKWVRGVAWGMSSTPFVFAPTGTAVFAVGELAT